MKKVAVTRPGKDGWSMDQSGGGEPVSSGYIKGRTEKIPVDVTEKGKGVQDNLSFMSFMPK